MRHHKVINFVGAGLNMNASPFSQSTLRSAGSNTCDKASTNISSQAKPGIERDWPIL